MKSPINKVAPRIKAIENCEIIDNINNRYSGGSPVYDLYKKSAAYIRQQNVELKYSNDKD